MSRGARLGLYLTLGAIVLFRIQSPVMSMRTMITFYDGNPRLPEYLTCLGNGSTGSWSKRGNTRNETFLIGNVTHTTYVDHKNETQDRITKYINDSRYTMDPFLTDEPEELGIHLDIDSDLNERERCGRFYCTIGNETKPVDVPFIVPPNGYSSQYSLHLQCRPPNGFGKPIGTNDGSLGRSASRNRNKMLFQYPPYNVRWFINGTFAGVSKNCTQTHHCTKVVYATNTTFPGVTNYTIEDDTVTVNNTLPTCLKCRVKLPNGDYGGNSVCSPGVKDASVHSPNRVGLYGGNIDKRVGNKPNTDRSGATSSLGGGAVLVGSVMIVCAAVGVLYMLTEIRKKKYRPDSRTEPKIYKPLNNDPNTIAGSSAV